MLNLLSSLCAINAPSGKEAPVREYIISQLPDDVRYRVDALGNLLVHVKGKNPSKRRVMLDAHMDEVGLIITGITPEGLLRFSTIGGIDPTVLLARRVLIENSIEGVIGAIPIHLLPEEKRLEAPETDKLYIDIGAKNRSDANALISPGDTAVLEGSFERLGEHGILSKALDDRVGCAVLLKLLQTERDYDYYVSFSVQEEVGLRGAKTAAFSIDPDCCLILEGTTAADLAGVAEENRVCALSHGAAVSFMDGATLYDKEMYHETLKLARENGIAVQPKTKPSGGNNAGSVHVSCGGVKTCAVSLPCRYIHSASSVCDARDIESMYKLAAAWLRHYCQKDRA